MMNMNSNSTMNYGMGQQVNLQPPYKEKNFLTENQIIATAAQAANVAVQCTNNTQIMLQKMGADISQTIIQLDKKKRRKQIGISMFMSNEENYGVCKSYDDGTQEVKWLFVNVRGKYDVQEVKFERYLENNEKYVLINFPESNCSVWCEKGKAFTRSNLYRWFLEAGIKFCMGVTQKEIELSLFDAFVGQVKNPKSLISYIETAGWNENEKWYSAENFGKNFKNKNLCWPIMKKFFPYLQNDKKKLEQFFTAFAEIKNLNYRIVMLETLVYAVLSSILTREGWTERYFLNFVLVEDIDEEWFCRLYQVFNRNVYSVLNAGKKTEEIVKVVRELNDEVLILSMPQEKNVYKQKKSEEHMDAIVHKICGQDISTMDINWKVNAALVVLNHHISDSKKAINILTDKTVFSDAFIEMLKSDAVDSFLSSFVSYIEKHMQEVKKIMRQCKEKNVSELLSVLWEILKLFCNENEINLHEVTKVEKEQGFYTIVSNLTEKTELDETIVMSTKERIEQVYVQEKSYGCKYMENCYYWDEEYYFIPTKIFQRIMKESSISKHQMKWTLLKWKDDKLLIPDDEGITYRLRLDKTSIETYRFKRVLFDRMLDIEMKDLGMEIE